MWFSVLPLDIAVGMTVTGAVFITVVLAFLVFEEEQSGKKETGEYLILNQIVEWAPVFGVCGIFGQILAFGLLIAEAYFFHSQFISTTLY